MEFDILDNEKYIYSHSSKELIDILYEFPKQFKKAEKIFSSYNIELKSDYKNILILGVGNPSNSAFRLIKAAKENKLKVPVSICSSKIIPFWVSKKTLVIAVSHSGETHEVLQAIEAVLEKGIDLIAITTGGKLKETYKDNKKVQIIEYSELLLPRMAIGYSYVMLVGILSKASLLEVSGIKKDDLLGLKWNDIEKVLFEFTRELMPEINMNNNIAKKVAINLYKNIPIIYGCSGVTGLISYKFKTELCATSKIFAHFNTIPEIDHDEIEAWEMNHEFRSMFMVLLLKDIHAGKEILKMLEILKGIFIEKGVKFEEIIFDDPNDIVKAFKGIFLASWVSLYLAVLNNVNPVSIHLVDIIKKRMGEL
ncbi:MAG: SIS domain-containing protein [Actinobacteria bacterium]|nr:SIS domain-containing protein [Actinomycetota bacterium]